MSDPPAVLFWVTQIASHPHLRLGKFVIAFSRDPAVTMLLPQEVKVGGFDLPFARLTALRDSAL
jgi:hypothetical protein